MFAKLYIRSPYRQLVRQMGSRRLNALPTVIERRHFSKKQYQENDDDVLEAEIVKDKTLDTNSGKKHGLPQGLDLGSIGRVFSRGFERAKEMVGMDERSIQQRKERKMIDAEIDMALKGTGLMGALLGKFVKMGTHMVTDQARETAENLAAVKDCTEIVLLNDPRVRDLMAASGASQDALRLVPLTTALHTVQEQQSGPVRTQYHVSMSVLLGGEDSLSAGGRGRTLGTVSVVAELDDQQQQDQTFARVKFQSVLFRRAGEGSGTWKIDHEVLKNAREIVL